MTVDRDESTSRSRSRSCSRSSSLFVSNRLPVGLVAIGAALAAVRHGRPRPDQALAGFGDPAVIFIATLFVVSEGLDATGRHHLGRPAAHRPVGDEPDPAARPDDAAGRGLTALISVNGAVAALLPVVVVIAVRLGRSPSQLLMPLVFGAHAGSHARADRHAGERDRVRGGRGAGGRPFGFFEFALVGIPLVVGTIAIVVFVRRAPAPDRTAKWPADRLQPARPDARRPVPARTTRR